MKTYKITIGDPWDFKGPDGQNLIRGIILKREDKFIIFKSNNKIMFEEGKGDIFVLSLRHINTDFSNLKNGVSVNGGLILSDHIDNLSAEEIKRNSKFVFIGSIREE